jgi:hypothetical protein
MRQSIADLAPVPSLLNSSTLLTAVGDASLGHRAVAPALACLLFEQAGRG